MEAEMFSKSKLSTLWILLLFIFSTGICMAKAGEGLVEFKLVNQDLSDSQLATLVDSARQINKIPKVYGPKDFAKINQSLQEKIPPHTEIVFEPIRDHYSNKTSEITPYLVNTQANIEGEMLNGASLVTDPNQIGILLSFNPAGTRLLADLTKANIGKCLLIIVNNKVLSAPIIREKMNSGKAQISFGSGDPQNNLKEAQDLVKAIQSRYHLKAKNTGS
jgi:preprotein translocase subunit SecD